MINACSPGCDRVKKTAPGGDSVTDLQVFTRLCMGSAKAETGLTLGNKVDASMISGGIFDKARFDRRGSQLTLLRPLPSIGVGQHQLDG